MAWVTTSGSGLRVFVAGRKSANSSRMARSANTISQVPVLPSSWDLHGELRKIS